MSCKDKDKNSIKGLVRTFNYDSSDQEESDEDRDYNVDYGAESEDED